MLEQAQLQTDIVKGLLDKAESTDRKANTTKRVAILALCAAILVPMIIYALESGNRDLSPPRVMITVTASPTGSPK